MSLIRDALQYFAELASKDRFVKAPVEHPDKLVYINVENGDALEIPKAGPVLKTQVLDLQSLKRLAYAAGLDGDRPENAVIFISSSKVLLVMDYITGYAINTVTMPLAISPVYQFLSKPISGNLKSVLNSLRFNLSDSDVRISPSDVIYRLSDLKFETATEENHQVKPNDEGVSKSFKSKVTGQSEVPTKMSVAFQMYPALSLESCSLNGESFDTLVTVDLDIAIDSASGTITIRPFPGQMEAASIAAMNDLRTEIISRMPDFESVTFLGSP